MSLCASSNWIAAWICWARVSMLARTAVRKLSSNCAMVTPIVAACAAADRVARVQANSAREGRFIARKSNRCGLWTLAESACQSESDDGHPGGHQHDGESGTAGSVQRESSDLVAEPGSGCPAWQTSQECDQQGGHEQGVEDHRSKSCAPLP